MLQIVLAKDFTYLRSLGFDLEPHTHPPIQISLAEPEDLIWHGELSAPAFLIGRDEPHSLRTHSALHTFLLSPALSVNRELSHLSVLAFAPPIEMSTQLRDLEVASENREKFESIFHQLLKLNRLEDQSPEEIDDRIVEVIHYIDELESKRVAAGELAEQISLSESRLLHLFKEELHLTVRSYLLWLRLYEGSKLVAAGSSITEAAHISGFTDSAHFARVFRKMFGTTLSVGLGSNPELLVV